MSSQAKMTSRPAPGRFLTSIKNMIDPPFDPTLVENAAKLLDLLNRTERLQRLLNKRDERGYTLLHIAAEKNRPESLKCLLIKDANPNVRSIVGTDEVTPLHIAAGCGHLACLQLLVQSGGNIMAPDRRQLTPIDFANINGQDFCLNYLSEIMAQRQAAERTDLEDVLKEVERNLAADNVQTLNHWSLFNELFPISMAPTHEFTQLESMMYRHCVLINNRNLVKVMGRIAKDIPLSLHDASLLHAACRYGQVNLVCLLLQKFPETVLSVTNEWYHPLHVAVAYSNLELTKILVYTQVLVSQSRYSRVTGSILLETSEHLSFPLSSKPVPAKFGAPTLSGHTVLHLAVAMNNLEILSHLLKHLKDLSMSIDSNDCYYTPLHLAVYLNHFEAAQILLRKGANANSRIDPSNYEKVTLSPTPLAEAAVNKNLRMLHLLLEYGGEDKHHDALKACLPMRHCEMIVPLLSSLIKCDDAYKNSKQPTRKERQKLKMGTIDWSNLQLNEIHPSWIAEALPVCMFLRAQSIDGSKLFESITSINISHNKLTSLPSAIFQLPKVSFLNASNNRLESLPEISMVFNSKMDTYEWPCSGLMKVLLSKNQLSSLPEFLFDLPNLHHLDLSYNRFRTLPFAMWNSPKLYHFNCSHNQLEAIPTNWPQVLQSCTVLDATPSPTPQQSSPSMKKKHSIQRGVSRDTSHETVPKYLLGSVCSDLDSPTNKDQDRNETEGQSVSKLQDRLNICNGNLPIEWGPSDSREEIYEGLAILFLSNNQIKEIPENLPCLCPKLARLDLSHNQIAQISLPRSFPVGLKHLSLIDNPLTEIDSENNVMKPLPCTNPQVLIDAGNVIHIDNISFCLHRQHNHLMSLSVLELNNCQLNSVNFYSPMPKRHQHRKHSDMDPLVQAIQSVSSGKRPHNVQALARLVCPLLTRLVLSHNHLIKVPESICEMTSLNSLDMSHNDIIELPAALGRLGNLWEFPLNGLKLISPPHNIIERGKTKDIIGFLWSLLQRARPYHRMKLMLIGMAARGKTTLLERISEKGQRGIQENWALSRMLGPQKAKGPKLSTVGIVVSDWTYYKKVKESQTSLKSITFMTWDFGGQEEYYATHQCFLSKRSLYLAVWNVSHGLKGAKELKPWLLNIQARAPYSPVIIVGTHVDKIHTRAQKIELNECIDFISNTYGTVENRREGFPQVMRSMIVSCKNGRGINELRDTIFDVASQVKESTVARRGVGCGRIPEYRLLMDQLVPASYLQLEDSIRNIAMGMRRTGNPPVLNYKELRELVFGDPRTLISKHTADRELEQAVRFLHDNGTLLHYEDPLLSDFYFVHPQWLCDMLAHIVTVREINPLVRDGIMKISDFSLIFNDCEFPIRWQREYIRLLTTFEVAVELGRGELLIPSALPMTTPNLPKTVFPEELKTLPPLRHTYIVPFIPSGFWPRLMSRILTDHTIIQLAKEGCGITNNEEDQLNWVKWRQGMILQYGNLTLMTIEELKDGLFPQAKTMEGIKILRDDKWELHRKTIRIFGIDVVVSDVYPILKFPEMRKFRMSERRKRPVAAAPAKSVEVPTPRPRQHPESNGVSINIESSSPDFVPRSLDLAQQSHDPVQMSHDLALASHAQPIVNGASGGVVSDSDTGGCANKVVGIDQVDYEFEKLAKKRCRLLSAATGLSQSPPRRSATPLGIEAHSPSGGPLQASSWEKKVTTNDKPSYDSPNQDPENKDKPKIDEEKHDRMRAGLLSKAVDHISLLIEDWFMGVRPRHLVVPCPHCSSDQPHCRIPLERSFSNHPSLLPKEERKARGIQSVSEFHSPLMEQFSKLSPSSIRSRQKASSRAGHRMAHTSTAQNQSSSMAAYHKDKKQKLNQDPYYYAFRYEDCVVIARTLETMFCPAHGAFLLQYMAPDTLFLTEGRDILVSPQDLVREELIGHGAFATVYRARFKRSQAEGDVYLPVALKALTKEWRFSELTDEDDELCHLQDQSLLASKPLSRHSILEGFANLKKELSILSPLKHPHVIQLFGVMLRPLGLVLELANKGSLKSIIQGYAEANLHFQCNVSQAVITQVASAIQYLHSCAIIYRDLKSDNILVLQFPELQDFIPPSSQLGMETVYLKLSDYGISQFVATQGARGLVGTPGFMAPEILKYHGREVYTEQVDIFSFGMFMYELVTLRIPYENLTAQQANQANESGARPALTRKDFPCPVLLRELMVWCWQQNPDDRPTAKDIIRVANMEQFLRLQDGIRISNGGVVTATCLRLTTSVPGIRTLPKQQRNRHLSPSLQSFNSRGNFAVSDRVSDNSRSPPPSRARSQCVSDNVKSPRVSDNARPLRVSELQSVSEEEVSDTSRDSNVPVFVSLTKADEVNGESSSNPEKGDVVKSKSESDLSKCETDKGGDTISTEQINQVDDVTDPTEKTDGVRVKDAGDIRQELESESRKMSQKSVESDELSTADSGFCSSVSRTTGRQNDTVYSRQSMGTLSEDDALDSNYEHETDATKSAAVTNTPGERGLSNSQPHIQVDYVGKMNDVSAGSAINQPDGYVGAERSLSSDATGHYTTSLTGKTRSRYSAPQFRGNVEEPRLGYTWSPKPGGRVSPGSESFATSYRYAEEDPCFEVWAASSDAHHSVATVIEYNGRFTSVEDIEVGDSPVLCICAIRDKVWMGFEIGYLLIYDAVTKKACAQAWIKQYTKILSIVHISALRRVYVSLSDGSILAYDDDIGPLLTTAPAPVRIKMNTVREYHDSSQTSACLLVIPKVAQSQTSFELWVGQTAGLITVLDAETLNVIKFISNTLDLSRIPSYVAYLIYANLVCNVHTEQTSSSSQRGEVGGDFACVCVYGALCHGQYITRWNAESKTAVESFNCERLLDSKEQCHITSLHYSNLQLYVGLATGKILILDALTFSCLCKLVSHRDDVKSLLTIDLSQLQQEQDICLLYPQDKRDSSSSTPSMSHSGEPSPIHLADRSPSLSSVQTMSNTIQLLSFGCGFKSYFDAPDSKQYCESGFLLVWEAEHWIANNS